MWKHPILYKMLAGYKYMLLTFIYCTVAFLIYFTFVSDGGSFVKALTEWFSYIEVGAVAFYEYIMKPVYLIPEAFMNFSTEMMQNSDGNGMSRMFGMALSFLVLPMYGIITIWFPFVLIVMPLWALANSEEDGGRDAILFIWALSMNPLLFFVALLPKSVELTIESIDATSDDPNIRQWAMNKDLADRINKGS